MRKSTLRKIASCAKSHQAVDVSLAEVEHKANAMG